jgi:tungstate transport system ATP-binding protein
MSPLRFSGIEKRFGQRTILAGVDIQITPGQCQLLCGPNGAGKSTLLRILAGMEKPQHCRVSRNGEDDQPWRRVRKQLLRDFIYLHQRPYLFEGSVSYNLGYPLRGPRRERARQVRDALEWAGLAALAKQSVDSLSGGERQRVALVRAWLRRPRVMLLDEPTTNMDEASRTQTIELLKALKGEGVALMIATHQPEHFRTLTDIDLQLSEGRIQPLTASSPAGVDNVSAIGRAACHRSAANR